MSVMNLIGDTNTPELPMTDAEVNHLRRLLAWMRCEWMLDDDAQRGYMLGTAATVAHGLRTPEEAGAHLVERAETINKAVPLYVRRAVKMLTKALRDHERKAGIVEVAGFSPISELVEMPDGTVMHKDDVPRLKTPNEKLTTAAGGPGGRPLALPLSEGLGSTGSVANAAACFSPCRRYRYALWRRWGAGPFVMFVGLNPSTADETNDDPTIRRCIGFARAWGFAALCMTNLFAYRATQPADMMAAPDPVGPENDWTLQALGQEAGLVVAAWGAGGAFAGRGVEVRRMLPRPHYLRLTKAGHPGHPLYLPASLRPVEWVHSCLPNDLAHRQP